MSDPSHTEQHTIPLRIGLMLRAIDDIDGPGVYIRNLVGALLELDRENEYVLFYTSHSQVGRFGSYENVREIVLGAPGKILWDQLVVPVAARKERLDVLFHHKFSVPLISPCPTVVQQRGTENWKFPEMYTRLERLYHGISIPIYCRCADRVLTISDTLARELTHFASVPPAKMDTVYAAADPTFAPVDDEARLRQVREAYGLPRRRFFLMVAKGYSGTQKAANRMYPRKNVHGTVAAYNRIRDRTADCPPLVIAGPGFTPDFLSNLAERTGGLTDITFPGHIPHTEMPAVYSQALGLVFPSYSESFGIPLVEAMASGCPVITSNAGACPEVVGDAALIVSPTDVGQIGDAMLRLATDEQLQVSLRQRGLDRAARFSWPKSARVLLKVLTEVGDGEQRLN
jgi:glycosyltransferase involved in cell wall biosynthesis